MTDEQQDKLIQDLLQRLDYKQLYIAKDIYKADSDKFLDILYKVVNISDFHIEISHQDILRIKIRLNEDLINLYYDTNIESADKILKDIETMFIPIKLMANAYFINKLNEQFGGVNVEYNELIFNKLLDERLAILANEGRKRLSNLIGKRTKGLNIQTYEDFESEVNYRIEKRKKEYRMDMIDENKPVGLNIQTEEEFEEYRNKCIKEMAKDYESIFDE